MSKNTGQVNTGQGKDLSEKNNIDLAVNAITQCLSSDKLGLSTNYPFIILLILFYFTVKHSYNMITSKEDIGCNNYIQQVNYDEFISSFVYWIISFILIIIIKYNNLNIINNFVINTEFYKNLPGLKDKGYHRIRRGISIFDFLISGITSIMNIYFIILLLITLYKIIKNIITLIECDSEICTKSIMCEKGIDLSKVKYWNGTKCVGEDGHNVPTIALQESVLEEYKDTSFVAHPISQGSIVLKEDLYPSSIRNIIEFWTFNPSGTSSRVFWEKFTLGGFLIFSCCGLGYYVLFGFVLETWAGKILLMGPIVVFIIINLLFLINGIRDKTIDTEDPEKKEKRIKAKNKLKKDLKLVILNEPGADPTIFNPIFDILDTDDDEQDLKNKIKAEQKRLHDDAYLMDPFSKPHRVQIDKAINGFIGSLGTDIHDLVREVDAAGQDVASAAISVGSDFTNQSLAKYAKTAGHDVKDAWKYVSEHTPTPPTTPG